MFYPSAEEPRALKMEEVVGNYSSITKLELEITAVPFSADQSIIMLLVTGFKIKI